MPVKKRGIVLSLCHHYFYQRNWMKMVSTQNFCSLISYTLLKHRAFCSMPPRLKAGWEERLFSCAFYRLASDVQDRSLEHWMSDEHTFPRGILRG